MKLSTIDVLHNRCNRQNHVRYCDKVSGLLVMKYNISLKERVSPNGESVQYSEITAQVYLNSIIVIKVLLNSYRDTMSGYMSD